jgi:hypothetical protein
MTTLSVLTAMPSTRDQLDVFVSKTVAEVNAGNINPLQLKAQLKFIEAAIDRIDKETKDAQLRELSKYPKGANVLHGFKIESVEAGVKIDYSVCNDLEWDNLTGHIENLTEQRKQREKFLKALSRPTAIVDDHTQGEQITINPPLRTSTSSLKFTME